jgi:hypothetical protein
MNLYEPFQFLTERQCDQLIDYAGQQEIKNATTLGPSAVRNNRVVWYKDSSHWTEWIKMFNTIEPMIDWIQDPQIAFYKPGEEYKWHTDKWPSNRTHIRHFTLTCELQSATNGGIELENKSIPSLKKGQAIIFRPIDKHRALSPTEGERISLTIWAMALNPDKY